MDKLKSELTGLQLQDFKIELRKHLVFLLLVLVLLISSVVFKISSPQLSEPKTTVLPLPTPFTEYMIPKIPNRQNSTIIFVGDSMTLALGPHPSYFSKLINDEFDKIFAIDNYSEGSKNILSLESLISEKTNINGLNEKPAIQRDFDIIIIESFGFNPLSHLPLEEGLATQEETLEKVVLKLIKTHPESIIIFLATIAPDPQNYGRGVVDLSDQSRMDWAKERNLYIENFINYANSHKIPLVNVYAKSFNEDGSFRRELINPDDNIHPSQQGIEFIQEEIFNFIVENKYLTAQ